MFNRILNTPLILSSLVNVYLKNQISNYIVFIVPNFDLDEIKMIHIANTSTI